MASRVPFQDPDRINDKMLQVFSEFKNFRLELGTHVNHAIELLLFAEENKDKFNQLVRS